MYVMGNNVYPLFGFNLLLSLVIRLLKSFIVTGNLIQFWSFSICHGFHKKFPKAPIVIVIFFAFNSHTVDRQLKICTICASKLMTAEEIGAEVKAIC